MCTEFCYYFLNSTFTFCSLSLPHILSEEAKTYVWSDVVKGLNPEEESENTDLDKSWNELETTDSVQQMDLEGPDQLKAKRTRRQRKSTPTWRNQRVDNCRSHNIEGAKLGLLR